MKKFIKISIPVIPYFCYTSIENINKEYKPMVFNDPNVAELSMRLAEVAAKNTASAVFGKIRAVKAGHDKDKTISEMQELDVQGFEVPQKKAKAAYYKFRNDIYSFVIHLI